jgi:phosphoribosyl 1,2-cyclic phosphodiesterase
MRLTFYGVRGSYPQPDAQMMRYGGRTTCFKITGKNGQEILIDAGNGIIPAGKDLIRGYGPKGTVGILFSHLHRDHLEGCPFFDPAYKPGWTIHMHGGHTTLLDELKKLPEATGRLSTHAKKASKARSLRGALHTLQDTTKGFFPVPLEGMPAQLCFHKIEDGKTLNGQGSLKIKPHHHVLHPQGMWAYRITQGSSIFYTGDIETRGNPSESATRKVIRAAQNASLLIGDAQYTPEEYPAHIGWGHSTYEGILRIAHYANIPRVILTHHDPNHIDTELDCLETRAQQFARDTLQSHVQVSLAREKMVLEV